MDCNIACYVKQSFKQGRVWEIQHFKAPLVSVGQLSFNLLCWLAPACIYFINNCNEDYNRSLSSAFSVCVARGKVPAVFFFNVCSERPASVFCHCFNVLNLDGSQVFAIVQSLCKDWT